ncbi:hypothetical protein MNBD_BACTEROID03-743 [hydrothermal vent metagenome]|uniref:Uncharacterized protein n=1 Tax=hydrothermal vent metagenome TaxID=652676 RepID=A0A3B0T5Y6_9ZZZZ
MDSTKQKHRYIEWLSAEEMHETSLRWMSELNFVRDEQLFLNNLVKSHTLQLTDKTIFEESKVVVDIILRAEKDAIILMKKIQAHINQLDIMVDDIDQLKMEKAYIETHKELTTVFLLYMTEYREAKKRLFVLVSGVMKKQKQKRLLN